MFYTQIMNKVLGIEHHIVYFYGRANKSKPGNPISRAGSFSIVRQCGKTIPAYVTDLAKALKKKLKVYY